MNDRQDANPSKRDDPRDPREDEGGSLWQGEGDAARDAPDDRSGVLFDRMLEQAEADRDEVVDLKAAAAIEAVDEDGQAPDSASIEGATPQDDSSASDADGDDQDVAAAKVDAAIVAIVAEPSDRQAAPSAGQSIESLPTLVRLDNIHKAFGKLQVLRGVTLDIKQGQTTVVIGPSGTGKSVLLKHIVGLLQPDQGDVLYDGQSVGAMDASQLVELRKRIGFLFQMGALFDSMNVAANVCFPLVEHTRLSRDEQRARCERVLRIVGLAGIEEKMPSDLSGGQRKRVALARAIVMEPELVLYDEPTTGLDPIRGDVIDELIIELSTELGITSVVVTHDMSSARKIADRLVMLYDGQVIADGEPDAFYASENDLVQRFIHGKADQEDLDLIRAGFSENSA